MVEPGRAAAGVETPLNSLVEPGRAAAGVETPVNSVVEPGRAAAGVETRFVHRRIDPMRDRAPRGNNADMPFTYMLECSDGSFYVGSTSDLDRRLAQHHSGQGAAYTRGRLPVTLVWCEEHEHLGAAFSREKQIQNWSRAKRIALIEGRYGDLPDLARWRNLRG